MNTRTLDPVRAASIEQELMAIGTPASRLQRRARRARVATIAVGSVLLAGALTGGAIVLSNLPGETTVAPLGDIVTGSFTGTADVELGDPPADAAVVILDVTCTEGGVISVPLAGDGSPRVEWDCSDPIGKDTIHISDGRLPAEGTTFVTVTADPGTDWTVTAQYGTSATTPWGVNAKGQTYGVPNADGVPDLMAAVATNGRQGYILDKELTAFEGEEFINVYASDGETVIGRFPIGDDQE
ncbi:hypothetical protein [Microbacterium sp. 18062]|uniref:hypothetical protein n=1 Tax=Microbacterium sp. 18062 TaxID=2681410 RepID=UPI0013571F3F|nr:hypothetical protein [Microbacterium sp. 18062]